MKYAGFVTLGALAVGAFASASGANAAVVVFSDNFNSYPTALNWSPPANWQVTAGSVDLIGNTTSGPFFDLYPGNGGYVDLNGSSNAVGTLATTQSFAAGSYTLTFDLAGSARADMDSTSKTTTITIGDWSTTITLLPTDPYHLFTFTFATTGGELSFADSTGGNPNIGNILDNVTLSTAVPEPATWAMMALGFAGLGTVAFGRRRKTGAAIA
jgi:hypothetical protein